MLRGGAQEAELRAGTENLAGIVATGAAAAAWGRERESIVSRVRVLRDRLEDAISEAGATPTSSRPGRVASILPVK